MAGLTKKLVKEFCGYCAWVNTIWKIKRIIYDDNPRLGLLFSRSKYPFLLSDFGEIIKSYVLLSVVKLHDPAVDSRGNASLTLEYITLNGRWDGKTKVRLEKLKKKLDVLVEPLKIARNKILAHRDIKTIEDGKPLGRFGKGRSTRYFNLLQRFVNVVSTKTGKGIYPFNNAMPINDARVFLELMVNDTEIRQLMGWPEDYTKSAEDLHRLREKRHEVWEKEQQYQKALNELFKLARSVKQ